MLLRFNWLGLAGGITVLVVVVVSLFYPWWQLEVGENLVTASVSPLNTSFDVLGSGGFTVPLLWAANLVGVLTLLMSGVVMVIYSLFPVKTYSKTLLCFAYKKPLYMVLSFVIILFVSAFLIQALVHFEVPLSGSVKSVLPIPFVQGTTVSVLISAGFQWPFWLAVIAAGLCIAARIYHRRVVVASEPDFAVADVSPPAPSETEASEKSV